MADMPCLFFHLFNQPLEVQNPVAVGEVGPVGEAEVVAELEAAGEEVGSLEELLARHSAWLLRMGPEMGSPSARFTTN